ncbi:hypothetical protein RHGRI_036003 [Rhododendron griersonianum]|uniref:Uncharacterized protein n=1 Tax=Rhododendron griersonianum TaxID=479676 RepID=A0AAV6HS19_9ERIC|nr:hypothetical protein RHGRI_036003 [Rhododendron griersonianum]
MHRPALVHPEKERKGCIGTPREGKDASSSSQLTVSAHGNGAEISTTEEPGKEIELGNRYTSLDFTVNFEGRKLPLTNEGIQCKSLFIPAEEVNNHFPAVGIPAGETHHMEMLYFTDDRLRQHCVKIVCCRGIFQLMMEEFITDFHLGEGDTIRFYKADL